MGMIYRIYTEDLNRDKVNAIVGKYFSGHTIIAAEGTWLQEPEKSLIVEIITDDRKKVFRIAAEIKRTNNQESVLVTSSNIEVDFI